jgi:hypothetical protein
VPQAPAVLPAPDRTALDAGQFQRVEPAGWGRGATRGPVEVVGVAGQRLDPGTYRVLSSLSNDDPLGINGYIVVKS